MELSLNIGLSEKKSNTAALFKTKSAKVILFVLLTVLFCGLAYAGSDDGALGDIWSYMSESMTGAPGKILAAAIIHDAGNGQRRENYQHLYGCWRTAVIYC